MKKILEQQGRCSPSEPIGDPFFFSECQFRMLLTRERKRSERTKAPFLLMLASLVPDEHRRGPHANALEKLRECISISSREIDVRGWYRKDTEAGVIFTDIRKESVDYIIEKLKEAVKRCFGEKEGAKVQIRYSLFPLEDGKKWIDSSTDNNIIFPDLGSLQGPDQVQQILKRTLDMSLSFIGITLLLPVFALVSIMVKTTSRGPVFFKQERIGLGGKPFKMYKFRSMKTDSDPAMHKAFVERLIKGTKDAADAKIFKIKNDPRLTSIGGFIRKTSIDELPQLFNVLKGDMSLVGPRPPIPYEVEVYDVWHRRRLFETRPGITGLWQVEGRSRTTFDEMVRMDIRYSQEWSLWLDMKLLMKTPTAVVAGKGAY
jgi:exopolysaccharide biosynthesis polyprenyl glycosylphosphotransferase